MLLEPLETKFVKGLQPWKTLFDLLGCPLKVFEALCRSWKVVSAWFCNMTLRIALLWNETLNRLLQAFPLDTFSYKEVCSTLRGESGVVFELRLRACVLTPSYISI